MNQSVTVVAQLTAKAGMEEIALKALEELALETRKEDGCIKYELHQSRKNPLDFMFFEIWESQDALDKHGQSEHIKSFRATRNSFLIEPLVVSHWNSLG